ncbi:MAG: hypothetical protein F9K30_21805 [Dechloromonas sp.]|nr:MAG: hypothetical protein F9K30_21805 [Dechloromonas sp.]
MKEVITQKNVRLFSQARILENVRHDFVVTREVSVAEHNVPQGNMTKLGQAFHELLKRLRDRNPLSADEKKMLPWLATMRVALREVGAQRLDPEINLPGSGRLTNGRCDTIVHGGLAALGTVEVKVVDDLPGEPKEDHLFQIAGYAVLAECAFTEHRIWVAVAYVSFRKRKVRIFFHRGSSRLRGIVRDVLAA